MTSNKRKHEDIFGDIAKEHPRIDLSELAKVLKAVEEYTSQYSKKPKIAEIREQLYIPTTHHNPGCITRIGERKNKII